MQSDLDASESVLSSKSLPPPSLSNSEKEAIRQFCAASVELKQSASETKEQRKKWNDKTKAKRKYLQDWIREQADSKIFVMPRDLYKKSEETLAKEGLPSVPPYLRLQRNTTDANITPLVAETAVLEVDERKLYEYAKEKPNPMTALVDAIVDSARTSIRTHRESVSLATSLEKGAKPFDVPELPPQVAKEMVEMHEAQTRAKSVAQAQKQKTADLTASVKKLQPTVAQIMDKAGTTSQPVKLNGGQMHRIIKSTSQRAPKVTIKVFEQAVSDTITSMGIKCDTIEDVAASFVPRKKECIKNIQLRLNSLPKKQASTVKLVPVKQVQEESDEEEEIEE